jgi:ribosomal protein S21
MSVESVLGNEKVAKTMREFKRGSLRSGSAKGPKVRNRKQAIAIALSQARKAKKKAST